ISIRELQQNLKRVLERVERGQVIDVTRRRQPVARLTPLRPDRPLAPGRISRPALARYLVSE
nr:type II toxin-antitoxin system prevent-host-death family antitoxin [Acidobacteriota bacterium]